MTICNRFIRKSDLEEVQRLRDENKWVEKYPHLTSLGNHWFRDEALLKWVFALRNFGIGESGKKVIDLGTSNGCVPHVVADWGNDTTAMDLITSDYAPPRSSCKMLQADAFKWLAALEEESIDVVFDICAVHLFDIRHDDEIGNYGLLNIGKLVHRVLKKGGRFIISSDAGDKNYGQFSNAETFIKMIEKSGLKLTSPFDYTVDDDIFLNDSEEIEKLDDEQSESLKKELMEVCGKYGATLIDARINVDKVPYKVVSLVFEKL
tara:strand:+ start:238 stop:1026 length:789 start_codon:yes stop_codon:yes gene_type:complete